jgi:hypothetical protein
MRQLQGFTVRAVVVLAAGAMASAMLAACGGAYVVRRAAAAQRRATEYAKAAGVDISPLAFPRSRAPADSVFAADTNKDVIRCYFKEDLTNTYKESTYPGMAILPP